MRAWIAASVLVLAGVGCARPPEARPAQAPVCEAPARHYEWSDEAPASATAEARPRLAEARTIGVGSEAYTDARIYVYRADAAPKGPPPPAPPSVVAYGGYPYAYGYAVPRGYGRAAGGPPRTWESVGRSPSTGGTPPLGGNWGSPPSYGPRFPFSTGPANPWR